MNAKKTMAKKILYLQILPFHSGAYISDKSYGGQAAFPESYDHDKDYYYLVIQPMLRLARDNDGNRIKTLSNGSPGLVDYLLETDWADYDIEMLPQSLIVADLDTRRDNRVKARDLLAAMDREHAKNASFVHTESHSGKAVSRMAELSFAQLRSVVGDTRNFQLMNPLRDLFKQFAALETPEYVPVPFPPKSQIRLAFELGETGAGVAKTVTIDLDPLAPGPAYMKLTEAQWTQFCANNHIQREKEVWSDLTPDEQAQFRDWAEGVYVALACARRDGLPYDPVDADANADLKVVWDKYFDVADKALSPVPANDDGPRKRWSDWMSQTLFPPAKKLKADEYLFLFLRDACNFLPAPKCKDAPYWEPKGRLQYPRYYLAGKALRVSMEKAAATAPALVLSQQNSYHARFWAQFHQEATNIRNGAADAGATVQRESDLAKRIAAAIVFGERLRVPRPAPGSNVSLIEIREVADDVDQPDWMVTCNHSLLGQTPRLGPLRDDRPDEKIALTSLAITLPGAGARDVFAGQPIAAISDKFNDVVAEARSYRANGGSKVAMTLDFDPDYEGRIYFEQQMFNVAEIKVNGPAASALTAAGAILFGAPSALLDAIEPTAAFNVAPNETQIRQVKPRRQLLPMAALSNDLGKAPWSDVAWLARTSVLLRKVGLGGYAAGDVFEFVLSTEMPAAERALYSTAFGTLLANASTRLQAELWRETTAGGHNGYDALNLGGNCIFLGPVEQMANHAGQAAGCQFRLTGPALATMRSWLQGKAASEQSEMPLHLVLAEKLLAGHANLLAIAAAQASELGKQQMLPDTLFNFKPALGMDGIMERLSLRIRGPVPAVQGPAISAGNDMVLAGMLASFTKARFFMCPSAEVGAKAGRRDFWFSYPAAVLPLKVDTFGRASLAKYRPATRAAAPAYWVVQHFTAPPKSSLHHGIGALAAHPEERRYFARVVGAAEKWHIGASVENPFGVRLGASIASDIRLRHAAPLANLAGNEVRTEKNGSTPAQSIPFVRFGVVHLSAVKKQLVMGLDRQALQASLSSFKALATAQQSLDAGPKSLRGLYESLCDLRTAVRDPSGGAARLLFEAWRFDGNTVAAAAAVAQLPDDYQEFPALIAGLRKIELGAAGEHVLSEARMGPWLKALAPSYAQFLIELNKLLTARPPSVLEITFDIDIGNALHHQQILLYRTGLDIKRNADYVAPCPPSADCFELIEADTQQQMRLSAHALVGQDDAGPRTLSLETLAFLDRADSATRMLARLEYEKLATDAASPWRHSHEWITPAPALATPPIAARLLGEVADKVQLGALSQSPLPQQRADLFYILYGFVPLPGLNAEGISLDAALTYQFSNYLAQVLGDLVRGDAAAVLALIEIDLGTANQEVAALALKHAAVASAQLFATQVVRHWTDTVHDPAHPSVHNTARALVASFGAQYRDCMRTLLRNDPAMYAKAKGIAIGAFRPGEFPDQLAYLQITKRILKLSGTPTALAATDDRINTERFPVMQIQSCPAPDVAEVGAAKVHRFFADVLEDAVYGDFFTIETPRTDPISGVTTAFGDALARSAADFLSDSNDFAATVPKAGGRPVELQALHEEPGWVLNGTKRVYVLPARKPPAAPKPVLPDAPGRISTVWQQLYGIGPNGAFDGNLAAAFDQFFFKNIATAHRHFPASLTLAEDDGEQPATYQRIGDLSEPIRNTHGGTAQIPIGWHHVDTSCAHFYFLVDSSEENTIDLDRFDLKLIRRPLGVSRPKAALQTVVKTDLAPLRALLAWHSYSVEKERQGGSTTIPKPARIKDTDLDNALRSAIALLWPDPALLAIAATLGESFDIVITRQTNGWQVRESAKADSGWSSGLGSVVGVDVLSAPGASRKFLLHIVVLHQPWSTLEATLSVKRNWLDLDGDNQPDINPRFVMASDSSTPVWVEPSLLNIDFHDEKHYAPALRTMTVPGKSIAHWMAAVEDINAPPFSVADAFTASFTELSVTKVNPKLSGDRSLMVWNVPMVGSAAFTVEARADHVERDMAPRASSKAGPPIAVVPEREDAKVRQFMSLDGAGTTRVVSAPQAASLMHLHPAIKTPWPNICITWSFGPDGGARQSVMNVKIPLRWES